MNADLWRNDLCELLECSYPVLLAGMGGVSRHKLAAAVANAGGFGCLGMVRESADFIENEVAGFRKISSKPFGVNLIPRSTESRLLAEEVDACVRLDVPVVVLFWDVDHELVRYLKKKGIKVLYQIGSAIEAEQAIKAGVDAVIAQGVEAGGHVRGVTPVRSLVHEIAGFSSVPVVASGGIATGRHLLAMLRSGAQGVSCGTAFLATHESNAHLYHKEKVVQAKSDDTVITSAFWKNWHQPEPVRVIKTALVDLVDTTTDLDWEIAQQDGKPAYLLSTDSPLSGATGMLELMPLFAGMSCGSVDSIVGAGERLLRMISEAEDMIATQAAETTAGVDVYSSPCALNDLIHLIDPDLQAD